MFIASEVITSRQNPKVKWAASLSQKKARDEARSFLIEGEKLALEALSGGASVTHVFLREDVADSFLQKLGRRRLSGMGEQTFFFRVCAEVFDKISTEKSPQGVICVAKYLDFYKYFDIIYKDGNLCGEGLSSFSSFLGEGERAILLCSLRDPVNLGAVIRSAVAFGVDHLLLSADCADLYHPRTVRAAMGSLFAVKTSVFEDPLAAVMALRARGRRVYCAELRPDARPLSAIELSREDVFVIGNEGHGIPPALSASASGSVYIPISEKTESLNAAVAAAVLMWEQSKI